MIQEILLLTVIIEGMTIGGRLFFGPMKDTFKKYRKILKVRIHHGYTGLALVIIGFLMSSEIIQIIGWALFISDAIHHFIILPLWVGRTEFP